METKETNCHPKPLVNATCLLGEKGCYKDGKCHYLGNCEHKVLTNADHIRAMTDEELEPTILAFKLGYAPWCDHHCKNEGEYGCDTCILNWLKQPAEGA